MSAANSKTFTTPHNPRCFEAKVPTECALCEFCSLRLGNELSDAGIKE
jgi:hypothetical protein